MVFKIVLIEDSLHDQKAARSCFEEWSHSSQVPVLLLCYNSADDFFDHKEEWKDCHCIFLDIDLPSKNGIEIAKSLRTSGIMTDFVFLTAFREYVFDGYSVAAVDYLLKPLTLTTLGSCMQRILDRYQSGFYTFRSGNEIIQIPYSDILYFSSAQHYTDIITSDQIYHQRKTISAILSTLPEEFIQIHRTVVINLHKVYSVAGFVVVMENDQQLPVSKSFSKHLNEEFMRHMF